jgi:hypothetical protein
VLWAGLHPFEILPPHDLLPPSLRRCQAAMLCVATPRTRQLLVRQKYDEFNGILYECLGT